ncbi:hypothetical protein ATANTOWER_007231 [Ataeniobius toweri]|uniref:Uncharacterized protein n=1 Tax=Ataeniobius toweri TaxID=208326 RepID=A0ABU7BEC9_9TELE|nr:hypothetical protein [Ataeniobius toweri]
MPDGGPESPRSRMKVVFHGISELLTRPSFCLSNHPSHMPLGLPVPISCFRGPTGRKDPLDSFFSLAASLTAGGLPPRQAPTTLRPQLLLSGVKEESRRLVPEPEPEPEPCIEVSPTISSPSLGCHLTVVEGFECPNDPRSYVVRGFMPLVGSPKAGPR